MQVKLPCPLLKELTLLGLEIGIMSTFFASSIFLCRDTPIAELEGHTQRVSRLAYHPSGRFLGTAW